ncbi:MAG: hypothetical protein KJ622_06040 [Alphaproteobacteria bacterium]|nr:hypothetical protein [Alphaproteobacteria bacterium]
MSRRNDLCERVVDNIRNLADDWRSLGDRLARIDSALYEAATNRDRLRQQWQKLESVRGQKLRLIRQYQESFNRLDCFDLGFSHEVLNLP